MLSTDEPSRAQWKQEEAFIHMERKKMIIEEMSSGLFNVCEKQKAEGKADATMVQKLRDDLEQIKAEAEGKADATMVQKLRDELEQLKAEATAAPKYQLGQTVFHWWADWFTKATELPDRIGGRKGAKRPAWFPLRQRGALRWRPQQGVSLSGLLMERHRGRSPRTIPDAETARRKPAEPALKWQGDQPA